MNNQNCCGTIPICHLLKNRRIEYNLFNDDYWMSKGNALTLASGFRFWAPTLRVHLQFCSHIKHCVLIWSPCVCPGELLEAIQQVAESRLSPVRGQIINSKGTPWEGLSALYSLMVSYSLLRSGIGSLADPSTVREARGLTLTLRMKRQHCTYRV